MRSLLIFFTPLFLPAFFHCAFAQDEIIFQTEGSSFNPLISLKGEATVQWTFADGGTSNSLNPVKNYGSAGTRTNRLSVNPWSALKMINIGYDAGDGGSGNIPFVADQQVSKIQNLDLVKDYLEIWCSSYNLIDTLVFDDFILLDTVECYLSRSTKHVSLKNTPGLTRLCLEDNDLDSLDLSGCTGLKDLRGAVNDYSTIQFSESTEELWHICVRDNPQINNDSLFSHLEKFPNLTELFIWNTNQEGDFYARNCFVNSWVTVMADGNHYTTLDLSGGIIKGDGGSWISFNNNDLVSVNIEGFSEIYHLELKNNNLVSDSIDKILYQADQLGIDGYPDRTISLLGNEIPTASGLSYKRNLEGKGWIIETEGPRIDISGNGVVIQPGDNTPSLSDHTLFDSTTAGDSLSHLFTISNTGSYNLNLTGNPLIQISGTNAPDFRVSSYPASIVHAQNGTTTFEIMFKPTAAGSREAIVTVENDGADNKNLYYFHIRGTGTGTANISEPVHPNQVGIFPNPGHGIFHIAVPDSFYDAEVIVLNTLGRVILDKKAGHETINLSHCSKGIYYILIKSGQDVVCRKVIIE